MIPERAARMLDLSYGQAETRHRLGMIDDATWHFYRHRWTRLNGRPPAPDGFDDTGHVSQLLRLSARLEPRPRRGSTL